MSILRRRFTLILFLSLSSLGDGYPLEKEFQKCAILNPQGCEGSIAIFAEYIPACVKLENQTPPNFSDETYSGAFYIQKRKQGETAMIDMVHFLNQKKFRPKGDILNYIQLKGDPSKPHIVNAMLHD